MVDIRAVMSRKFAGLGHNVVVDREPGTYLKFTKPGKAAYIVNSDLGTPKMLPGMPLENLERLALRIEFFGYILSFVGTGGVLERKRIITRQNIVAGRPARLEKIVRILVEDPGFGSPAHAVRVIYGKHRLFLTISSHFKPP